MKKGILYISHLIFLPATPQGRCSHHHFKKLTEAQKSEVTCPRSLFQGHRARKWQRWHSKAALSASEDLWLYKGGVKRLQQTDAYEKQTDRAKEGRGGWPHRNLLYSELVRYTTTTLLSWATSTCHLLPASLHFQSNCIGHKVIINKFQRTKPQKVCSLTIVEWKHKSTTKS